MRFIQGIIKKNRFTQGYVAPIPPVPVISGTAGQPIGLLLALTRAS